MVKRYLLLKVRVCWKNKLSDTIHIKSGIKQVL